MELKNTFFGGVLFGFRVFGSLPQLKNWRLMRRMNNRYLMQHSWSGIVTNGFSRRSFGDGKIVPGLIGTISCFHFQAALFVSVFSHPFSTTKWFLKMSHQISIELGFMLNRTYGYNTNRELTIFEGTQSYLFLFSFPSPQSLGFLAKNGRIHHNNIHSLYFLISTLCLNVFLIHQMIRTIPV